MTYNEKIQAAAAVLQERTIQAVDISAFKVTITDGEKPAIELTPDRERIRKESNAADEQISCRAFYHMGTVVDVCRTFHLTCYISLRGDSYCVRIY